MLASTWKQRMLATLGPWIVDDAVAQDVVEESVSRTPRFAVESERWLRVQLAALQTFATVNASPDEFGKVRRTAKPGDLVILHEREAPRARVVLDVGTGGDLGKVSIFDPHAEDCVRVFMSSRVGTLAWEIGKPRPRSWRADEGTRQAGA